MLGMNERQLTRTFTGRGAVVDVFSLHTSVVLPGRRVVGEYLDPRQASAT